MIDDDSTGTANCDGHWPTQEGSNQQIFSRSVGRERRERGQEPGGLGDSHEPREGRQGIDGVGLEQIGDVSHIEKWNRFQMLTQIMAGQLDWKPIEIEKVQL
jgi:hypothetical protein